VIVVDTSAIVAILDREPNYEHLLARLMAPAKRYVPATVMMEATMVLSRGHVDPKTTLASPKHKMPLCGSARVATAQGSISATASPTA